MSKVSTTKNAGMELINYRLDLLEKRLEQLESYMMMKKSGDNVSSELIVFLLDIVKQRHGSQHSNCENNSNTNNSQIYTVAEKPLNHHGDLNTKEINVLPKTNETMTLKRTVI